jgi:hypothetical protein
VTSDSNADLTDAQLDRLLGAANEELLAFVESAADPRRTLTAILALNTSAPTDGSSITAGGPVTAAQVILLRSRVHRLGRALDLGGAIDLVRDLDRALRLDLDHILAVSMRIGLDRVQFLARDLDHHLVRALDRASTFADAFEDTRFFDPALDLVRTLDGALAHVRTLRHERSDRKQVGVLDRRLVRALSHHLDRALDLVRALIRGIGAQPVDASGADLSGVEIDDLDVLNGVIWTGQTIWPPGVREQVRDNSEEIRPGVYQVRTGKAYDWQDLAHV